jgi:hypothetical protein
MGAQPATLTTQPRPARRTRDATHAAATSVTVWLTGLIVVSAVVRFIAALWTPVPWIFADELDYSELAKSFAATGHFAIRDVPGLANGPVYPLLISPAYALFDNVPHAYVAIKAINAAVISLVALPVFFLARRLVSQGWAITAAALSLTVPSLAYSGMVMTENVFLPLFAVTVLAVVRALERPTAGRQVLAVALVGLAVATRSQAIFLAPAVLTAIALVIAGDAVAAGKHRPRALLESSLRFMPTMVAFGLAVAAVALREAASGRSLLAIFGQAEGVWHASYSAGAIAKWFVYHVAELDLYSGILPFAAFLVLGSFVFARGDRQARVVAAVFVSTTFWLLLTAAAFISSVSSYDVHTETARISDRYTFYALPLMLIAIVAWVARRLPRSVPATAIAAAVAGLLPLAVPYKTYIRNDMIPDTFGLLPWATKQGPRLVASSNVELRIALISLVLACLFVLLRPPRLPVVVIGLVVLIMAAVSSSVVVRTHEAASYAALWIKSDKAWVDRALPGTANTVVIWTGHTDPHVVWETEFFNRSVGDIYYLRQPSWAGLPEQQIDVRHAMLVDASGRPLRAAYILADPWVVLRAPIVARDRVSGMRLYRLGGRPARIGAF